jgi:hypothetical protein
MRPVALLPAAPVGDHGRPFVELGLVGLERRF